jgi:hypothetical protein
MQSHPFSRLRVKPHQSRKSIFSRAYPSQQSDLFLIFRVQPADNPYKVWLALPIKSQEVVQDGKRNSLASSIGLF